MSPDSPAGAAGTAAATRDLGADLALVQEATNRLVRTVDSLEPEQWTEPSGLPGWTRAHVVGHLALNGEGLAAALRGVVAGEQVPMYASQEARDGDIAALGGADRSELRDRLLAAGASYAEAAASVPDELWGTRIERTPGGRSFSAVATIGMRWREVEIHHVDLDAGYERSSWTPEACRNILGAMAKKGVGAESFTVRPLDVEGSWGYGDSPADGPTVTGTAADLGWWLTGRGSGEGVSSSTGTLPQVGAR
jgi:maleylpyruvate isomerase